MKTSCDVCNRPYGAEYGFPDLIIPYEAWAAISGKDDAGLLCPSCICKRLHDAGIRCEGAFMSGPINSITADQMSLLRRVENIELALSGRKNRLRVNFDESLKEGSTTSDTKALIEEIKNLRAVGYVLVKMATEKHDTQ